MRALASFSGVGVRTGLLGGALTAAGLAVAVYFTAGSAIETVSAQDVVYFRIGAGTPGSTYYGIAGRIAGIISNPPGSRQCDGDGACGVEGLLGLAQTTTNPIDGLESLRDHSLEATLVSADIAEAALRGTGAFKDGGAMEDLRAVANVSSVMLHILVPKESKATDLKGLTGKKIAIGMLDSDSALTARFLLRAAGLNDKRTKLVTGEIETVAQDLAAGKVDALAVVEQLPGSDIANLMSTGQYRLLPAELGVDSPAFVISDWIASGTYSGTDATRAIGVPVVLVARADLSSEIAGGLVRALWRSAVPGLLDMPNSGIPLDMMSRASVPWHPGAAEAFQELSKTEPAALPPTPPTN